MLRENQERLSDFGVKKLGLFGSYVKGEQGEESDLDFLVELEDNNFDDYMGLKLFLENLFDREVDLVIEGDLKEGLEYVRKEAEYVTPA